MSDSDGDDKTGVFKFQKTRFVEKKLQVQMPSGKIYGPYARLEVLTFIQKKKIRGEEKILLEGETSWRPIASDTEFYDAILVVLSGKNLNLDAHIRDSSAFIDSKEKPKHSKSGTRTEQLDRQEDPEFSEKTRITNSPLKTNPARDSSANSFPEGPEDFLAPAAFGEVPGFNLPPPLKGNASNKKSREPKKATNFLKTALIIALLVMGSMLLLKKSKPKRPVQNTAPSSLEHALQVTSAPNYTRILRNQLGKLSIESMTLPVGVQKSEGWNHEVPEYTLNGIKLISKIKKSLELKVSDESLKSSFWVQLSSDFQLLGIRVQVVDIKLGQKIESIGKKIQKDLDEKKLISADEKILIDAYRAHSLGDWLRVETLAKQSTQPILKWLLEDSLWWSSWGNKEKNPLPFPKYLEKDPELDISTRIRQAFRAKDSNILGWLQHLANVEPASPLLWLSSAELSWRNSKTVQVQSTYRDFTIGIGSLVLYPPSIQLAYWGEFSEFLKNFARVETHSRALKNIELLSKGGIGSAPKGAWWDLEDPGLLAREIADDILAKSKHETLSDRDRAALMVLGSSLVEGTPYLFVVGQHLALAQKWNEAEKLFRQMIALAPQEEDGYFGLVWSLAEQFRFVEAEDAFDEMVSRTKDAKFYLRTEGLLHYLGRDYEEAHRLLSEAIDRNPNDSWAHYFKASAFEVTKDYYKCVQAGNLANLHAKGELSLFVESLLAKCQVYGSIGTQKTLGKLGDLVDRHPQDVHLRVLLVELLQYSSLPQDALERVNEGLEKLPYSPDMHIAAGDLLFARSNYPKALEYYTAAARLDPNSADGWIKIAKVMEQEQKYLLAAQNYVSASKAQPDYPEIYLFAARAFDKAGKVDEAAKYYSEEIEYRPESIAPFVEAAEFLLKNNAPQKVPELYQQFKGGYENDPRALIRLAQAYFVMGDVDSAKSYASRAVAQAQDDPQMNLKLAVILDGAGEYGLAKRYYFKYLELSPAASDADSLREKLGRPPYSN